MENKSIESALKFIENSFDKYTCKLELYDYGRKVRGILLDSDGNEVMPFENLSLDLVLDNNRLLWAIDNIRQNVGLEKLKNNLD